MKQLITSFAHYDYWANEKILTLVLQLTEARQEQVITSSFNSIHKTCSHMSDAYRIWWKRLQHEDTITGPTVEANYPIGQVVSTILELNTKWIDWVSSVSEKELEEMVSYKNIKGDSFQQPLKDILLHIFNHGTYHRGQLVTMLRQVGVEQVPQTDYIVYSR